MFWILLATLIMCVAIGVVYPVCAVIYYKLRRGKRMTVKRILDEIGF